MTLDNIDKQILRLLFANGRENLTDLQNSVLKTNELPMSHTGIRKRIKKLENSDILKIQGNLNVENLNYQAAVILLEMKNFDEIKKIKEAYKDCHRVFLLAQLSGRYNVIMGIVGQNIEVIQRYLNYCGPTNKEGVLHSEILMISSIDSPKYLPLNLFSNISQESKCGNVCKECDAFLAGDCSGCGTF